ncbi:hypothetical protein ILYODFUR_016218, partial [Ilyodon furcidens]
VILMLTKLFDFNLNSVTESSLWRWRRGSLLRVRNNSKTAGLPPVAKGEKYDGPSAVDWNRNREENFISLENLRGFCWGYVLTPRLRSVEHPCLGALPEYTKGADYPTLHLTLSLTWEPSLHFSLALDISQILNSYPAMLKILAVFSYCERMLSSPTQGLRLRILIRVWDAFSYSLQPQSSAHFKNTLMVGVQLQEPKPYQCKSADNIPVSLDRLILSLWSSTRGLPEAFVHLQLVWSEHPHVWTELRFTPTFHLSAAFHGPVVVQITNHILISYEANLSKYNM